jgi:hypothetical protein
MKYLMMVPSERYLEALIHANRTSYNNFINDKDLIYILIFTNR